MLRVFTFLLMFSFTTVGFAQAINAQLGEDSARFHYTSDVLGQALGRLELNGGLMYNDNDDYAASFGVQVRGENLDAPLLVALGARAYYGEVGKADFSAIALGGDVTFSPLSLPGLELGAHFFIAPEPVAFSDSEGMADYGIRVGYQIIPLSTVYIGYQKFEVDIKNGSTVDLEDGVVFGLNIQF